MIKLVPVCGILIIGSTCEAEHLHQGRTYHRNRLFNLDIPAAALFCNSNRPLMPNTFSSGRLNPCIELCLRSTE